MRSATAPGVRYARFMPRNSKAEPLRRSREARNRSADAGAPTQRSTCRLRLSPYRDHSAKCSQLLVSRWYRFSPRRERARCTMSCASSVPVHFGTQFRLACLAKTRTGWWPQRARDEFSGTAQRNAVPFRHRRRYRGASNRVAAKPNAPQTGDRQPSPRAGKCGCAIPADVVRNLHEDAAVAYRELPFPPRALQPPRVRQGSDYRSRGRIGKGGASGWSPWLNSIGSVIGSKESTRAAL